MRRARGTIRWRRLLVLARHRGRAAAGSSLVLPNTLNWKSDSPYLETARSVVNYKRGAGAGGSSSTGTPLRMSLHHPLLGVGPGNWAVVYPKFASHGDPSLTDDGMTANPWPSSDWMTFLSERGPAAFVLLALAVVALHRRRDARAARGRAIPSSALAAWALLGTLAVLLVVGTFDAVLLLPAPALVAWALLGALSPPSRERVDGRASAARRVGWRRSLVVACSAGSRSARSVAQLAAMASSVERARERRGARRRARSGELPHPPPPGGGVRATRQLHERADRTRARRATLYPNAPAAEAAAGARAGA